MCTIFTCNYLHRQKVIEDISLIIKLIKLQKLCRIILSFLILAKRENTFLCVLFVEEQCMFSHLPMCALVLSCSFEWKPMDGCWKLDTYIWDASVCMSRTIAMPMLFRFFMDFHKILRHVYDYNIWGWSNLDAHPNIHPRIVYMVTLPM